MVSPIKPSALSYIFLGVFLVGIFALQWWQSPSYPLWVWAVIAILICGSIGSSMFMPTVRYFSWPALAGSIAILLCFLTVARTTVLDDPILQAKISNDVTIQGKITKEPEKDGAKTTYAIKVEKIVEENGNVVTVQGLILASDTQSDGLLAIGSNVVARGRLIAPKEWQKKAGFHGIMAKAVLTPTNQGSQRSILAYLYDVKSGFEYRIRTLYPEPHASLLAGLLTGSRSGLPYTLAQDFQTTGLTHIIAISGYNITIIISLITALFSWLPYKWRFVPAVFLIIVFTLFVGASPSVVRAAIMGVLGLLALQVDRMKSSRLAVLWALFFMILWNPRYLWFDIGFQLSFLAVIGVMEITPLLNHWLRRVPQAFGIRDIFFTTIAVQIFSVPWIVFLFGRFSVIAPVANVLTSPFIPLAMLFGFLSTIFSWFLPALGQIIAIFGWGSLEGILLIATRLAKVPYASFMMPKMHFSVIILYYVFLGLALVWLRTRRSLILAIEETRDYQT